MEQVLVGIVSGITSALTMVLLMKFRMMPLLAIYIPKDQFEKMKDDEEG